MTPVLKSNHAKKIIVVKPKDNVENEMCENTDNIQLKDAVRRSIDPLTDPVSSVHCSKNGKVIIICKDDADVQTIKSKVTASIGDNFEVADPKSLKPRLKIVGDIDTNYTTEQLEDNITRQNAIILPFKIDKVKNVFDRSNTSKYLHTVIEITCGLELLNYLLTKKKVKIGWSICRVYELAGATICYKCSKFGHIEKSCTSEREICPKCSGPHRIKACKETTLCCPNCKIADSDGIVRRPTNHLPWSYDCPVFNKKSELAKKRIVYDK